MHGRVIDVMRKKTAGCRLSQRRCQGLEPWPAVGIGERRACAPPADVPVLVQKGLGSISHAGGTFS